MHQHHLHHHLQHKDRFSGARNFTLEKCYFSPKTTCFEIHPKKRREKREEDQVDVNEDGRRDGSEVSSA